MSKWYYATAAEGQQGPVSFEQLAKWAQSGQFGPEIIVWRNGMPSWLPAREVAELAGLFGAGTASTPVTLQGAAAPGQALSYETHTHPIYASPRAVGMLQATRPWVRFFSVLLFIGVGLIVIAALFQFVGRGSLGRSRSMGPASDGAVMVSALAMLGVGTFYLVPALYLGRYATKISDLLRSRRPEDLEAALQAQKSFWKFSGIAALVVIALYIVMIGLVGATISRW